MHSWEIVDPGGKTGWVPRASGSSAEEASGRPGRARGSECSSWAGPGAGPVWGGAATHPVRSRPPPGHVCATHPPSAGAAPQERRLGGGEREQLGGALGKVTGRRAGQEDPAGAGGSGEGAGRACHQGAELVARAGAGNRAKGPVLLAAARPLVYSRRGSLNPKGRKEAGKTRTGFLPRRSRSWNRSRSGQ